MSAYNCPECGSENCQKLSLIYQQGYCSGTISTYGYVASTESWTAASASASPPENPFKVTCGALVGLPFLWGFAVLFMGYIFRWDASKHPTICHWFMWGSTAFAVFASVNYFIRYPASLRNWHRTFQCQRCATYFRVDP